jgi:hypothetical protein
MRQFAALQQMVRPSQACYTVLLLEVDFHGLYYIVLGSPRLQMAEGDTSYEKWCRRSKLP